MFINTVIVLLGFSGNKGPRFLKLSSWVHDCKHRQKENITIDCFLICQIGFLIQRLVLCRIAALYEPLLRTINNLNFHIHHTV